MKPDLEEVKAVYRIYKSIAQGLDPENGLGGRLLYAGPLDEQNIRLLRAANIAGAASLTVAEDPALLRKALRDGAVDFFVTHLDEALRILKNEVRKKQPVAVGVHGDQPAVEAEMQERGVRADLALAVALPELNDAEFLALTLPPGNTAFAAELDAAVWSTLPAEDILNRRWYKLSPRYLGREFRNVRTLVSDAASVEHLRSWYQSTIQV